MPRLLWYTRRLASQHNRRRLPRALAGLATPNLQRRWDDMADLSREEKAELLHGAWREAKPIQLTPDTTDRDSGGFTSPVSFRSEEEAHQFLVKEDADDQAELNESTLQLAQRFFVELATAADAEVDAGQIPPAPQSDEERRQEMRDVQRQFMADFYVEQKLVAAEQRHAFVDAMLRPAQALFLVNGVHPLVRLTVRDQLEAHQSASEMTASTENATFSPSLLSSSATGPVLVSTTVDPCLFAVPLVPTQAIGAPLHVPYTVATSPLSQLDEDTKTTTALPPSLSLDGTDTSVPSAPSFSGGIGDADMLSAMLLDDGADEAAPPAVTHDASKTQAGEKKSSPPALAPSPAPSLHSLPLTVVPSHVSSSPPTLAHTYWLQRQVATDALLNVDHLSLLLSLLSVHLAAAESKICSLRPGAGSDFSEDPQDSEGNAAPYEVILYQSPMLPHSAAPQHPPCTYHTEMAQYLFKAAEEAEEAPVSNCVDIRRLDRVVLVVEDTTARSSAPSVNARKPFPPKQQETSLEGSSRLLCEASETPVVDRYPNVVYVTPSPTSVQQRWKKNSKNREMRHSASPVFRSRVVVCVPSTSRDGLRPRGWLSGGEAEDENTASSSHDAAATEAPPDNFVERCQEANANFTRLQTQLYQAIRSVDVGTPEREDALKKMLESHERGRRCGWVLYATQSMNVIENEAVVCAVLQRIQDETQTQLKASVATAAATQTPIKTMPPLHVACVRLASPAMAAHLSHAAATTEALHILQAQGRPGLSTWVAIENGAEGQEAEQYLPELRSAVAQASWRADPLRTGGDGGYLICLRVSSVKEASLSAEGGSASQSNGHSKSEKTMTSRQTDRRREGKGTRALEWWTHPSSGITAAVTFAVKQFVEDVLHRTAPTRCHIIHAGVPVAFWPPSLQRLDEREGRESRTHGYSSAISHVTVLKALQRSLPVLTLSVRCMSELLLRKRIDSHALRHLLRIRAKQMPHSALGTSYTLQKPEGDGEVEKETTAFIAAVEQAIREQDHRCTDASTLSTSLFSHSTLSRFAVWVGVSATSCVNADAHGATTHDKTPVLHPSIVTELEAAGVVAHIAWTVRAADTSSTPSLATYDFSLSLEVPLDMPERAKHTAALEEYRVALRDALLYVCRRTGAIATPAPSSWRLWPASEAPMTHEGEENTSSGVRVPPGDERDVELAEDEYEAISSSPSAFPPWSQVPSTQGESDGSCRSDWLAGTNYREWRRQQSLK